MSLYSTGHDVVDQVGSVHFEGNILPTSWFSSFLLDSGKPDLNAIVLLSEIVYWHRPTVVRDEYSGQVLHTKKKFKADLLQRSYQSFSDQFGFSKLQVKDAFDRLEKTGVIKRHWRTIEANNQKYNNVLYIELVTPVLFEMTTLPISKEGASTFQKVDPPHFKRGTNTENTTEITTDINTQENLWTPNLDHLKTIIKTSKHSQRADEILSMPDFKFHLGNFNAHWENKIDLTENQKTRKFASWLIKEFEDQFSKTASKKQMPAKAKQPQSNRNVNDAWANQPVFTDHVEQIDVPEDFV